MGNPKAIGEESGWMLYMGTSANLRC
jgi:hypothetical protein